MDALIPVALWLAMGALTGIISQPSVEVDGHSPWWVDALCLLSWPLLLAVQVLPISVTIDHLENDDEG